MRLAAAASTTHHRVPTTSAHLSNLNRLLSTSTSVTIKHNHKPSPLSTTTTTTNSKNNNNPWLSHLFSSNITDTKKPAVASHDETISPKSLHRLQLLLSDPPSDPSPRQTISHRWRLLHGSHDWSSLLDPLDHDLRRELLRYGDHVQSTYLAFHHSPHDPHNGRPLHVDLPDASYRLTRHLHATSSISLPSWVRSKVPSWLSQRSSWVGYIAVCDDPREIRRLGRRDIVIALRGTATCLEWAENLRTLLVELPDNHHSRNPLSVPPKVQLGFRSLISTAAPDGSDSLADAIVGEVRRLAEVYRGEELSVTVTGHSLGAALALLVADELAESVPEAPPATVFTFGGPRVGNRGFALRLKAKGVRVLRVVNEGDVVTRVPGVLVSEDSWTTEEEEEEENKKKGRSRFLEEAKGKWGYSHVGSELRVDSSRSPYLREDVGPACCHDLEAYLHLVDGFLGSTTPFRENAKRSIHRLMSLHGVRVLKKLYTKQAVAMGVPLRSSD